MVMFARLSCNSTLRTSACSKLLATIHILGLKPAQKIWRSHPSRLTRTITTMPSSSSRIDLSSSQKPVFYVPGITPETADKANELLQENHDKHHIYFNYAGFHVRMLSSSGYRVAHGLLQC